MRVRNYIYLLILVTVWIVHVAAAEEIKLLPAITSQDRILILAPHPDDESIATGGIIQSAVKIGAKGKIVCFTNGDHNQWAFIADTKRIPLRQKEFIYLGEMRRKETISAMAFLGIRRSDIIFLGYPDDGTLEIFTKYWNTAKPFETLLTRISKVPYQEALSPNAPYIGKSVLKDLETVITDFKPTRIFVSHPADGNRDHQALYLFLRVALWDLEGKIPQPQVYPYLIHMRNWPLPKGYHPELALDPLEEQTREISWQRSLLTLAEVSTKYQAITYYKTQFRRHLYPFVRKNELFGDYQIIKLQKSVATETSWYKMAISAVTAKYQLENGQYQEKNISGLAYVRQDDKLLIRLSLKRKLDKDFGVSVYLLGYTKKTEFARMPKLRIALGIMGMRILDKNQPVVVPDAWVKFEGLTAIITVPLKALGNPEYIFSAAHSRTGDFRFDEIAWRIIELE